ncbi:hypothetical protein HK101_008049 [Irineochytrium annulatum]|nr:hypothetical protein HK101_008049 [Irineochytrium annulatum]
MHSRSEGLKEVINALRRLFTTYPSSTTTSSAPLTSAPPPPASLLTSSTNFTPRYTVRNYPSGAPPPWQPAALSSSRFTADPRLFRTPRPGSNFDTRGPAFAAKPELKGPGKKKKGIRNVKSEEEFAAGPSLITAPSPQPLRACAFSTAENYDFQRLLPILQRRLVLLPYIADDVFHIRLADPTLADPATVASSGHEGERNASGASGSDGTESDTDATTVAGAVVGGAGAGKQQASGSGVTTAPDGEAEAYMFNNGTFVTWGATDGQISELLGIATEVAIHPYATVESEWFDYYRDTNQPGGISADTIIIGYDVPAHQAKLAFSSGLARSAKLASLEELLDAHLHKHRHIPQVLLSGKKLPMGRAEVLRNLGELFSLRGHVNLHSELLDSPDFCWSSAKMEEFFDRISRNLDVRPRIAVFNKKLDYANEVAEVLRNHLHEQHSSKLEIIIIVLIRQVLG